MVQRILGNVHSIRFRLIVPVVAFVALFVGLFAFFNAQHMRSQSTRILKREAGQLCEALARALRPSMMAYDADAIRKSVGNIGSQEGVEKIRIYSKIVRPSGPEGREEPVRIAYSSDPSELRAPVDMAVPQCRVCHADVQPLTRYEEEGRHRIFVHEKTGHRVLGVIQPIYNEESCWAAECHVHDEGQRVLGVFDVILSLEDTDRDIVRSTWTLVAGGGVLTAALTVFIGLFIRQFVARPVARLREEVRRIAEDALGHEMPLEGKDEFVDQSRLFTRMTEALRQAREEVEEGGRRLEARVEERTAELRVAQEQILQSEKLASLGKLAASVAHEINNPLTGILTFVRMFQEWVRDRDFPPEKVREFREYLQIMADETLRSSKIVHGLLAFARRSRLDVKPTSINEVVEQCLVLVAHQMELQGVEVARRLAPDIPPVPMDHGQIQQTLVNILLNASEAMPEGGTVTVETRVADDPAWLQVSVSDEGVGIPAADIGQLFDPFFTTKEEGKGTGLGLSVAYGIIEKHGGRIEVESAVGRGTTFRIFLPLRGRPGADEEAR